jgi:hypothetical protein
MTSAPTKGELYAKLAEHLTKAQEVAAMLKHLNAEDGDDKGKAIAQGWFKVSEGLKEMGHAVNTLAQSKIIRIN